LPSHLDPFAAALHEEERKRLGLSETEIVELATAFRRFGFWRLDLGSGLFFASREIFKIFDMPFTEGPMNLIEVTSKIHPEDLAILMETFERSSSQRLGYHNTYRVRQETDYKLVRSVAKYRDKPESDAGEIVGITYECLDSWQPVTFSDD